MGEPGTCDVDEQPVTITEYAFSDVGLVVVALLLIVAAASWILRRGGRTSRPPEVGAVSVQWLTQHRISRPDRSQ